MLPFSNNSARLRSYATFGWVILVAIIFVITQFYGRTLWQDLIITAVRTSVAVGYWYFLRKYLIHNHVHHRKRRFTINMRSLALPLLAIFPALVQALLHLLFNYSFDSWPFDINADPTSHGITALPFTFNVETPFEHFIYSLLLWWIFFVIWGSFYVFISYCIPYSYREPLYLQTNLLARETELRKLETQINADFIFDTLHSLATQAAHDPAQVKEMTLCLTDYLRFSLNHSQERILLGEEIKAVYGRLRIEQFLRDQACTYEIQIHPPRLQKVEITTPLVLPLVDYLFHSLSTPIPEFPIDVQIRITADQESLHVSVSNQKTTTNQSTACPLPLELEPLARKLSLVYGENARLGLLKHDLEQITLTLSVSNTG